MTIPFFDRIAASLAVAAVAAAPLAAGAQEVEKPEGFGERPLTMIVPYGAGGGSDQLSRAMAAAMENVAGLTIQVVNKPGGGGTAAIPDFMLARADGYTILESIDDAVTSYVKGDIDENPAEDWIPICMAQITFNQIYVRPDDDRFSDWESFVEYAKENPGQATIANLGTQGAMELVTMSQIEDAFDIETKQIAFDKPAERYGALIGGHVDALFEQPGDVRNFIEADQMVPILTLYNERPETFADVPTHREAGADFEPLTRFRGFYVKAGTPEPVVSYLQDACKAAFDSESFQKFNKSKYMDLIDSYRDTEGAKQLINTAIENYQTKYEEMGIETR
ncbi:MAG TPA: tripartite tricarboxylate transporter substrate binding protein [Thermohalobaculum sp.]|nr:tripartite tricarboxylate transporter substrate binding protein [Thermohalobaculum sp.]